MSTNRFLQCPRVELIANVTLSEVELAAMEALAGYDIEEFLKTFYAKMGEAYLRPHEKGLRSLFASIRSEVPSMLSRARDARAAFAPAVRATGGAA